MNKTIYIIGLMTMLMLASATASVCSKADWNNDKQVSMMDIVYFANHYGAEKGDSLYHRHYDLNKDGVIDMADIVGAFADCYTR